MNDIRNPSLLSFFANKNKHLSTFALSLLILAGCSDRVMLADEKMAEIRASQAQPMESALVPERVDAYVYNAADLRSPFTPTSLLIKQKDIDNHKGIIPDFNRPKQTLETYDLSQLVYRGIVVSPKGESYGLIQRPDGIVDSVKVGDYMGMNYGRIVEITPTQVNLIEIVKNSRDQYVERAASIASPVQ